MNLTEYLLTNQSNYLTTSSALIGRSIQTCVVVRPLSLVALAT